MSSRSSSSSSKDNNYALTTLPPVQNAVTNPSFQYRGYSELDVNILIETRNDVRNQLTRDNGPKELSKVSIPERAIVPLTRVAVHPQPFLAALIYHLLKPKMQGKLSSAKAVYEVLKAESTIKMDALIIFIDIHNIAKALFGSKRHIYLEKTKTKPVKPATVSRSESSMDLDDVHEGPKGGADSDDNSDPMPIVVPID